MRLLPLTLLALFAFVDVLANWHIAGMRSVSEQVWNLGWPGQLGAGTVMLLLAAHLALEWPYGP
jgi:hypothetical protein